MRDIYNMIDRFKANPARTGIFSDLDGTLSKIAETPDAAVITSDIRSVLEKLAEKYGIVGIVSGRDSDEARKIVGLDNIIYAGNHGLEWLENGKQFYAPEALNFIEIAQNIASELSELLRETDVLIERKKLGVSLHYRLARDKDKARESIEGAVKPFIDKYPIRRLNGRYVVELKPDLPINKGDAVTAIAIKRGLENVMYLGDDITDIDAFRALGVLAKEGRIKTISVAVASDEAPSSVREEADLLVKNVDEVESLLRQLAESPSLDGRG